MRYFSDAPMFGADFMCARLDDTISQCRQVGDHDWRPFDMPLSDVEQMVDDGFLLELSHDPFKELDCPSDGN